jgi:hypothetical protein
VEKFGRYRQTLSDALACEDYEDTGILELQQVKEAIASVDEDCNEHLMDWMLYYVYSRSEHVEKMEYKVLINMLDEAVKKERVQSAKRRPESSNPEKIKQHNRMPAKKEEEEDNYSSDPQIQVTTTVQLSKLTNSLTLMSRLDRRLTLNKMKVTRTRRAGRGIKTKIRNIKMTKKSTKMR